MTKSPETLLSEASQLIGNRRVIWTQGAGGNLSIKENQRLWIKGSGFRLSDVTPSQGIAEIDLASLKKQLSGAPASEEEAESFYATTIKLATTGPCRPSMETGFHAELNRKWVLHFHSLPSLLMAHEFLKDPVKKRTWFSKQGVHDIVCVPACRPGWLLTQQIALSKEMRIFLLESHGLILQSDTEVSEVSGDLARWRAIEKKFCQDFNYPLISAMLESNNPFELAWDTLGNKTGPLKIYFPDTAVFLDRLRSILSPIESQFRLREGAIEKDCDAVELWLATQALFQDCPQLAELPDSIAATVASLPTEVFRRERGATL